MKTYFNKFKKVYGVRRHQKYLTLPEGFKAISFTFDDVPRSGITTARQLLNNFGVNGTFYVAMSFSQPNFERDYFGKKELKDCLAEGHELACHTYGHIHFFAHRAVEKDIIQNQEAIKTFFPYYRFQNFSYPFGEQTSGARKITKSRFRSARSIEPGLNQGTIDLNNLKTISLYEKVTVIEKIKQEILPQLEAEGGWLILYTHDVQEDYSPYGCSPRYFQEALEACISTKIPILTVDEALDTLGVAKKG